MVVVEPSVVTFAGLLRQLRIEAGLTQEELAAAAGLSSRSVSDLERGVALTARKETTRQPGRRSRPLPAGVPWEKRRRRRVSTG